MFILDILSQGGAVGDDVLKKMFATVSDEALRDPVEIIKSLVALGANEGKITEAIANYYALPVATIDDVSIDRASLFNIIPEDSVRVYHIAPIRFVDENTVEVGVVDPGNADVRNIIDFIFSEKGMSYELSVLSISDYEKILKLYSQYYMIGGSEGGEDDDGGENSFTDDPDSIVPLEELLRRSSGVSGGEDGDDGDELAESESAPITRMVAAILMKAIKSGVSDIHIERLENKSRVRYRLDGVLSTNLVLSKKVHRPIVARIKILARLKLDEKRRPQDGRFPAVVDGRTIDFRVSTMPTFYGEKVVIRILDPGSGLKTLADTGMSPLHFEMVKKALSKPYGIILITGPTGSGKSTTLQAMLQEVDRETENVISLEDPVEYKIEGVSQSQVRPEIGYTFATGLRSILRQDPDKIMVGEIRDEETARLAIQAALTGHMVFSTLHTNTAIGAVPRLIDMGIEPYLIAPTLILSVAQRLARKIIPGEEQEVEKTDGIKEMIRKQFEDLPDKYRNALDLDRPIYDVKGSTGGVKGRVAVFEMVETTPEIERIIIDNPTEDEIYKIARSQGFLTMRDDAYIKCMNKQIRFRDVNSF